LTFVLFCRFLETKKKNNLKSFLKKSHNQKIPDAQVLRKKEKETTKQVMDFDCEEIIFIFFKGKRSTSTSSE
jgi:hypothetical protein